MNGTRNTQYALLAILLAGFFLRFHDLARQSLWLDEAYTWDMIVSHDWAGVWGAMLYWSNVSPLSYVLTKLILPVFGANEFTLRLPGAFFGWLAIPVVYRLGQALFDRRVGLAAAAFVAFSPFAVWYAREARAYGLYLFLSALALWGFVRAERGRGWAFYILASAALYITHYISALYVYAQAVYILTQLRRQPALLRRWSLAQLPAVAPAAVWVIAFLSQRRLISAMDWIPAATLFTPLQTLWNFVSGDAAQPSPPVVVGSLVLLGLLAWGARSRSSQAQLLSWWLVLPLATAWLFSLRKPSYVDRYFEPAILSVALLVAIGILSLPGWARRVSVMLTVGGLLFASARLSVDPKFAKEDWRGGAQMIAAKGLPVSVPDPESPLALSPYISPTYVLTRTEDELSRQAATGPFVLVLRSPHESAHALSKSAPFEPRTEGPPFFRQWLANNPAAPLEIHSFTGFALIVIGEK
jgi:uncharacterized membrane protein